MQDASLKEWTQTVLALVVVFGGGILIYLNGVSDETTLAIIGVIGVVLGFYFGSSATSAVTKAATTAATDAVMRSLDNQTRGVK